MVLLGWKMSSTLAPYPKTNAVIAIWAVAHRLARVPSPVVREA